jgi:O-antigen ligase/tetratricopeptide (TPR) repeat protein
MDALRTEGHIAESRANEPATNATPIAASAAGRWSLVAWASIAVLAAYCLFIGGSWGGLYLGDVRRLSLILTAAAIGVWLVVAWRNPAWRPRTVLWPGFLAALVAMALATATSAFPRLGLEYLAWAVLLTALYLLLVRLMASPFFRPRVTSFATIAAFGVGIAYVALVIGAWIGWWSSIGRIAAPPLRPGFEGIVFGNPSAVLTVSVLLTATAVAHLLGGPRSRAILAVAAVALSMAVALLTGSRAGWLALAIAVVVTGAAWLLDGAHRRIVWATAMSKQARRVLIPVAIVAIIGGLIAAPGILVRAGAGGDDLRSGFYAAAIRMFQSSPMTGVGPGNWVARRLVFSADTDVDMTIPHAHNIYLQTLAESGVLGALAGLVVIVLLVRLLYRAIRDDDPSRRRIGWCALFATIYFGSHQLLDFYANQPAVLFAFAIPIAWLDATLPQRASSTEPKHRGAVSGRRWLPIAAATGLVAVVGSVAFLGWSEAGAARMQKGVAQLDTGDAAASVESLRAAVAGDPAMPPYHFALGLALADTGDLAGAASQFEASTAVDAMPEAWLDLAAVRARLGDRAGAQIALGEAMRIGRQQSGVALGTGVVKLELGDREGAVAAFADALAIGPSFAGDLWWTADPERAAVWPEVYARAFAAASPVGRFELAIETSDRTAAMQAIAGMTDPEAARTYRLVLDAWSGDAAALAALEQRGRDRPLVGLTLNWLARIHVRAGNAAKAAYYVDWGKVLSTRSDTGAEELRIDRGQPGATIAGTSALFYGHFGYRRPTPTDQFVPWLPHLVSL